MRIQPISSYAESIKCETVKPAPKSRLKRLFDRPFSIILRSSSTDKDSADDNVLNGRTSATDSEPNSVCLDKLVRNFIEENGEKPSASKCGRRRCNCFNANSYSSEEDEDDADEDDEENEFGIFSSSSSPTDAFEILKSITSCASMAERNLLADTSTIVHKNKNMKRKELRSVIVAGLRALSYNAAICNTRWEESRLYPAVMHEFIEVLNEGERLLIDVDFRAEFEIARPTSTYKSILQTVPYIFVGEPHRLQKILAIVSEAAKQSMKKKGMPVPPWRKLEYMRAKWLSSCSTFRLPSPPHRYDGVGKCRLTFGRRSSSPEKTMQTPQVFPDGGEVTETITTGSASPLEDTRS